MAHGDASKVSARGPGIEPSGNVANKATYFDIYTAGGCTAVATSGTGGSWGQWGALCDTWPCLMLPLGGTG